MTTKFFPTKKLLEKGFTLDEVLALEHRTKCDFIDPAVDGNAVEQDADGNLVDAGISMNSIRAAINTDPVHTNLCLWSRKFDNAAWTKSNATITADAVNDPEGNATADKFAATATGSAALLQLVTINSGATVTLSVYAKKGDIDYIMLSLSDWSPVAHGATAHFDVNNGVATGTTGSVGTDVVITATAVEAAADDWYRCSMTCTTTGITTLAIIIYNDKADGAPVTSDAGQYVYLWQCDLIEYDEPLSPIETEGSAVTSSGVGGIPSYAVATLPDATQGLTCYVTDAVNGAGGTGTMCVADGTNWIDVTTGVTVVSSDGFPVIASYTVAGAPSTATAGGVIYVSDETGGAVLAFGDGTNWRRVTDRAVIS